MGYFNTDSDNDGVIDTVYFKIEPRDGGKELDMGKYVLPPAGTSAYPFVGNFDGNGCVISNLTISNSWEELKSSKPATAKQNGEILQSAEIVGFFGIVGQYETTISYDSSANEAKDLYFDNLTVESAASSVLAGFIAGYANGAINNCGIHCGQFSFVSGATGLSNGKSISEYTLIGDYGSKFTWTNKPTSGGSSSESGSEWGGSVDFRTVARRINYMFSEMYKSTSAPTKAGYSVGYTSNDFNLYSRVYFAGSPSSYQYNYESVTVNYAYASLNAGTYLPINVDMGLFDEDGNETSDTSTSYGTPKWNMGGNYEGATSEKIASGNPGFIVGGGGSSTGYGTTRIRISKYSSTATNVNGTINKSITALDSNNNVTDAGIRLLTYVSSSDSFKLISDEYNNLSTSTTINGYSVDTASNIGLMNYSKSRSHFKDFLVRDNVVYGLYVNGALGLDSYSLSAKLSDTETNYQLVNNGINFKAKEAGVVTMIVGVYTANNNTQYMPNIYKVERNDDGSINGQPAAIDSVYENTYSNGSTTYSINEAESEASSSKQVYAKTWYDNKSSTSGGGLPMNYAIYQEIPVPAGDYVVGNGNSSVNMTTILYLDIGANGSASQKQDGEIKASNIDFVYKENNALAKITDEGYTPSGVVFSVGGTSIPSSAGLIYFKRESKENTGDETVVIGVAYYTTTGCSIEPSGNGRSKEKEPAAD